MPASIVQSRINQIQREIQTLNRKLADLAKDEAAKTGKIASISRSINRHTSTSQIDMKTRETQRLQDEIVRLQETRARTSTDLANRTSKLHDAQQDLYREQEKDRKKMFDDLNRKSRINEASLLDRLRVATTQVLPQSARIEEIKNFDAFISHATEDKDSLVRPLADALIRAGHNIWYDEFQLKVGDSLRRSIDRGLSSSRFGIVVLSPSFFAKQWPHYELDGLVTKEIEGGKVILPIWHKVTKSEVISYSPSLADKLALNTTTQTIEELAKALSDAIKNT